MPCGAYRWLRDRPVLVRPLSPLLQYGFLLLWGAMGGVSPLHVLFGCPTAALMCGDVEIKLRCQAARQWKRGSPGRGDASCVSRTIPLARASTAPLMIEPPLLAERNAICSGRPRFARKGLETSREGTSFRADDEPCAALGVRGPLLGRNCDRSGNAGMQTHEALAASSELGRVTRGPSRLRRVSMERQ